MNDEQRRKKNERQRLYYAEHREEERSKARDRRAANPDLYREQRRQKYWRDPVQSRANTRASYAAHAEARRISARHYREQNREVIRLRKRCNTHDITRDDYFEMWNLQAGRCAICLERLVDDGTRQTHVDHDHATGRVRGLLCDDCNVGLGRFYDEPESLRRAADYVLEFR